MQLSKISGKRIILALLLVAGAIQGVRTYVGTWTIVDGDSMFPTLNRNNIVRAKALHSNPTRGDVVILTDDCGERVMKRVIGLPGETVSLFHGFVYINRQRLSEPYLPRNTYTFKYNEIFDQTVNWRLGRDEYFVLGDYRLRSDDSRNFGPVPRHRIHSLVTLPEKQERPGFCEIRLVGSGKATSVEFSRHGAQTSSRTLASNSKT